MTVVSYVYLAAAHASDSNCHGLCTYCRFAYFSIFIVVLFVLALLDW